MKSFAYLLVSLLYIASVVGYLVLFGKVYSVNFELLTDPYDAPKHALSVLLFAGAKMVALFLPPLALLAFSRVKIPGEQLIVVPFYVFSAWPSIFVLGFPVLIMFMTYAGGWIFISVHLVLFALSLFAMGRVSERDIRGKTLFNLRF